MSTNELLFDLNKPDLKTGIVNGYAEYLAATVSEMKFIDIKNLQEYFKAHLNIFFSEALESIGTMGISGRIEVLQKENEQLAIDRAEMEEELNNAKSRLRERKFVDAQWMSRCNYAFKMKGIRIQTNCREIGKLTSLKRKADAKANIEYAAEKDEKRFRLFTSAIKELIGLDKYKEIWQQIEPNEGK